MKILLTTLTILVAVTATPIAKLESEHEKNNIDTAMMKSNALGKPAIGKLETKLERKKKPLTLRNIVNGARNVNLSGVLEKLSDLKDSFNVSLKDSKLNDCIYDSAKSFVLCELKDADQWESLMGIWPLIKCASTAVIDFVTCYITPIESLQSLRDDIGAANDTNALYEILDDQFCVMFDYFNKFYVNELIGIDYYLDVEDTTANNPKPDVTDNTDYYYE